MATVYDKFDVDKYVKSEVYKGNDLLVDPETSIKRCECCKELFYSSYFPDVMEIVDGKLPVCLSCFRSKAYKDKAAGVIKNISEIRICRKCKKGLPVESFASYRKNINGLAVRCDDCRPRNDFWDTESP